MHGHASMIRASMPAATWQPAAKTTQAARNAGAAASSAASSAVASSKIASLASPASDLLTSTGSGTGLGATQSGAAVTYSRNGATSTDQAATAAIDTSVIVVAHMDAYTRGSTPTYSIGQVPRFAGGSSASVTAWA